MSELTQYQFVFSVPKGQRLHESMGSIMQGVLMETIDTDYAAYLHQSQQPPYSQFAYYDKNSQKLLWTISTLTAEATHHILEPLSHLSGAIHIRNKNLDLPIIDAYLLRGQTYEEFIEMHILNAAKANLFSMEFITTTSFKSDGKYQIFPHMPYIMNSLYKRWLLYAPDQDIQDFVDLKVLSEEAHIMKYRLQSSAFHIEKSVVPGFKGELQIRTPSEGILKNIYFLLADFATFSGVGIKTAIGMGAVHSHIVAPTKKGV